MEIKKKKLLGRQVCILIRKKEIRLLWRISNFKRHSPHQTAPSNLRMCW